MAESVMRKRIAPSLPLRLELEDADGTKFVRNFKLSFTLNTLARIQEKTGVKVLGIGIWAEISPQLMGAMLWAALLPHSPEYDTRDENGEPTDEGLEVIRSYVDMSNLDQVGEALWESYLLSVPKEKAEFLRKARAGKTEGEVPNVPTPETGESTGSTSGQSPDTTSTSAMTSSAS